MDGIYRAVDGIGRTPQIREVILSGGDPLLLPDSILTDLLQRLRALAHIVLLRIRVRPYDIRHPDPVAGTGHPRVPLSTGLRIVQSLRRFTSGLAVPHYMIGLSGGGGKVPLPPAYVKEIGKDGLVVGNYERRLYEYRLR